MALMHEGVHEQVFLLPPFTVEKYILELRPWAGRHHVDLVCYLRLRRWASKRKVLKYEARVSYEEEAMEGGSLKMKCTSKAFDTAEEAAAYADEELVKFKGPEAWTNFPLTSFIRGLPLDFLPLSDCSRQNRTYKRTKLTR